MKDDQEDMFMSSGVQYRVFRLTREGPEELNFVEWASDLNRNHPIAKLY